MPLRRGAAGRGAVALRGVLAAGRRGDGLWRPGARHDGGAIPEVIGRDGETGFLVPPGDPEALAAGIRRALDAPELSAKVGEAGRRRVLERFTWRETARGTAEYYEAVIARKAGLRGPIELPGMLAGEAAC